MLKKNIVIPQKTYEWNALGMLARNGGNWLSRRQYLLVMFNELLQERSVLRSWIFFGRQVLDLGLDVAQILRERIIDKSLEINTPMLSVKINIQGTRQLIDYFEILLVDSEETI